MSQSVIIIPKDQSVIYIGKEYDVIMVKDNLVDLGLLESDFLQFINHELIPYASSLLFAI